jgi:hypothetical protein
VDEGPPGASGSSHVSASSRSPVVVGSVIDTPDGGKYSGSPHTAAQDGSVTATYQTASGDTAGTYTVVATGDHGTSLRATFRAEPGAPTT